MIVFIILCAVLFLSSIICNRNNLEEEFCRAISVLSAFGFIVLTAVFITVKFIAG